MRSCILSKPNTKFEQSAVNPLFNFRRFLDLGLFRGNPSHHNSGCLFIESSDELFDLGLPQVVNVDGADSGSDDVIRVLEVGDCLDATVLRYEKGYFLFIIGISMR